MATMAEPATRDLIQLDAFHALLPALAGSLDIRDVFQHLSAVASRIVPHDEANLALATDDGTQFRLYASTREGAPELVCREDHGVLREPIAARLIDAVPGPERGLRSGVCAPVFIDDAVVGVFALFSRRPHAYSPQDLALVQRLAAYVAVGLAHQRLAEAARHAAVERERTASIESSVELLRTISGVLDIRTVFPQVSEIANKVLPHDLLTMMFDDRGQILIEVASSDGFPEVGAAHQDQRPQAEGRLRHHRRLHDGDVADRRAGRSAGAHRRRPDIVRCSRCSTRARDQEMGLGFWSKRPHAFGPHDVPVARRLADHVALAVSHEQLAAAARQVAEAHARAERLESRVQSLVDELESKSGHARVVGQSPEWIDILKKATQVAATETTVLLTGESGTGKEVVARFIHRASARKGGPFVALNCAALPEQLLESELFGYERGAFTGAQQSKPGQIELAAGGVLFLDEVERDEPVGAGQVPARAPGAGVSAARRHAAAEGQRPGHRGDQPRSAQGGRARRFSRGSLLPAAGLRHPARAAARAAGATSCCSATRSSRRSRKSFGRPPAGLTREAREALLAARLARATSGNCATRSSGRRFCARAG